MKINKNSVSLCSINKTMSDLSLRDIKYLQGVGPQRASILEKELNIRSFKDLLYYFPYKYVDRSRLYYIHEIDGNMPYIQLRGQILSFETFGEGRQRRLVGHFSDGTGVVDLVWFQGLKFIEGKYKARELLKANIRHANPTLFSVNRPYSTGALISLIPTSTRPMNWFSRTWGFSLITIPPRK